MLRGALEVPLALQQQTLALVQAQQVQQGLELLELPGGAELLLLGELLLGGQQEVLLEVLLGEVLLEVLLGEQQEVLREARSLTA